MKRKLFPLSVFAFTITQAERFAVQIVCDDPIDLSGMELMIYEEIGTETEKDGSETVHEDYSFSVYTDSKGNANFKLPEKRFSVNLNLASLPEEYGADTYTKYFGNGEKNGSFTISKVKNAEIVNGDTGYTVAAYAENGLPLMVDAKVSVAPAVMQAKLPKTYAEYERYDSTAY